MEELRECPCGNEAHLIFEDGIKVADPWSVSCKNLDCPWIFQTFTTREEAVKCWNTRHNPLESEVAELREALKDLVERVDRARGILQRNSDGEWCMLDTKEAKQALANHKEK